MAKRILIVEDEPEFLDMLSVILSKAGYEVEGVDNGRDVLPVVKEIKPDLIILDVMLPGMDGHAIVAALSKESDVENIPVIMLTALVQSEPMFKNYNNVKDFCSKLIDTPELIEKIQKLIGPAQ